MVNNPQHTSQNIDLTRKQSMKGHYIFQSFDSLETKYNSLRSLAGVAGIFADLTTRSTSKMTDRSESLDTVIQSTSTLSSCDGNDGRYSIAATPTIDKPPDKEARFQARLQLAIMMGLAAMPTEPHSAFLSTASKIKIKQTNDTIVMDSIW